MKTGKVGVWLYLCKIHYHDIFCLDHTLKDDRHWCSIDGCGNISSYASMLKVDGIIEDKKT